MRTPARCFSTTLAALLALILPAACERPSQPRSAGSDTTTAQSDTNAADEYRALYDAMTDELKDQIAATRDYPGPDATAALEGAKPIIDRLVWATTLERCDWAVDLSAGYDAAIDGVMPNQTKLRTLASLLRADAYLALQRADSATAATNTAAIVNLSVHASGPLLVQTMTAGALVSLASDVITRHASDWTDDDRAVVRRALASIDLDDPYGGSAAFALDQKLAASAGSTPVEESMFNRAQQNIREKLQAAAHAVE